MQTDSTDTGNRRDAAAVEQRYLLACLLALLLACIAVYECSWILASVLAQPTIIPDENRFIYPAALFLPEQQERLAFCVGCLLALLVPALAAPIVLRLSGRFGPRALVVGLGVASVAMTSMAVALVAWCLRADTGFAGWLPFMWGGSPATVGVVFACASWLFLMRPSSRMQRWFQHAGQVAGTCLLGLSIALIAIFSLARIQDESSFKESTWEYVHHFASLVSSTVQAQFGKTLLVDMDNTYGLYPHLLQPIFWLIGLNVLTFTIVFSILTAVALALLLRTFWGAIGRKWLAGLGFIAAACFMALGLGINNAREVGGGYDPYYQYLPLRVLFPAIFLFLVWRRLCGRQTGIPWALYAVSALAVLWNPDSGLAVIGACGGTLVFFELSRHRSKEGLARSLWHLCFLGLAVLAALAAYSAFAFLRTGSLPDFIRLGSVSRYYLDDGFMMAPLKVPHPWMLVAFCYVVGLAVSVTRLWAGRAGPLDGLVFALSVLGCGLLGYFQGRSENGNLYLVAWPSVFLATLFADRLLVPGRGGTALLSLRLAGVAWVLVLAHLAGVVVRNAGPITSLSGIGVVPAVMGLPTRFQRTADFLAPYLSGSDEAVILSHFAWYYHLNSLTRTPFTLTALSEVISRDDFQQIAVVLQTRRFPRVFVDDDFIRYPFKISRSSHRQVLDVLAREYRLLATSPDRNMSVYELSITPGPSDTASSPVAAGSLGLSGIFR